MKDYEIRTAATEKQVKELQDQNKTFENEINKNKDKLQHAV